MLKTDRLILRQWRPEDREPFAAMNADRGSWNFFLQCSAAPKAIIWRIGSRRA
jgi:RimJ/RimL family protein N-acetyltransferase